MPKHHLSRQSVFQFDIKQNEDYSACYSFASNYTENWICDTLGLCLKISGCIQSFFFTPHTYSNGFTAVLEYFTGVTEEYAL